MFAAESLSESLDILNSFKQLLLIVIPSSILIGGIVGSWITRQSLKPLEIFSLEVSQVNYKNINKRINSKAHARELNNLAESFNMMLDRLQKAFKAEYENERKKVAL
jgi:signal transduction histidine kinase